MEGNERSIPKIDVLRLSPGETIRIVSPEAAATVKPLASRSARRCTRRDDGFVPLPEAESNMASVVAKCKVDIVATEKSRKQG